MRILAIAPHPDDETLGCGGALLKHKSQGDSINWLIMTRGHEPQWSREILVQKEQEIADVNKAYGFDNLFRANLPTIRLDTLALDELINSIREAISAANPDIVYLNHYGDVHSDHKAVFEAAMSVLKPFYSARHAVKRVLSYEILSSTDAAPPAPDRAFIPNIFTDISKFIDRKLEIMALYATEMHQYPLPRSLDSIRALARLRGSTIGTEYAEAFSLVREVD
jgi:LmbE family N-acetylglucosaminyl deacetylase